MHRVFILAILSVVSVLTCGCTTTYYQRQDEEARLRADVQRLNSELGLLRNQVSELSLGQEHNRQQLAEIRGEQVQNQRQLNERMAVVEQGLQGQAAERQRLRGEIVNEISGKVAGIVRSSAPPPPSARSDRGYEHVVKAGQTLSEIATAYNAKVDAIVRANGLKDANSIRVGQKLFIPE